jgi:hypothetical protein
MTQESSYNIGHDGFVWYFGVVEGHPRNDTLKIGRTKVRIIGWHTAELSVDALPWAMPIYPVNVPGGNGVPTYKDGDWVMGFFLDGMLGQQPMILGILPTIPQGTAFFSNLAQTLVKTYIPAAGVIL